MVRPREAGRPFELVLAGPETPADTTPPTVRIMPSTGPIGLEIVPMREAGRSSLLRLSTSDGPVTVREGDRELNLDEPSLLDLAIAGREAVAGAPAKPNEPKPRSAPEWLTATQARPTDVQRGESFLKAYRADRDVVPGLLEATASDRKDARELAIAALAGIDDFDLVIEAMGTPNNRGERLAAIRILRSVIDRGPDGRVALAKALERVGGKDVDWAETVQKLLTGFTAEEAAETTSPPSSSAC